MFDFEGTYRRLLSSTHGGSRQERSEEAEAKHRVDDDKDEEVTQRESSGMLKDSSASEMSDLAQDTSRLLSQGV